MRREMRAASQGRMALSSQSWHGKKGSSDSDLVRGPKQLFILRVRVSLLLVVPPRWAVVVQRRKVICPRSQSTSLDETC